MLYDILSQKGNKNSNQVNLPDNIFNIIPNKQVLYYVVNAQTTNSAQGTHHTKTRAEVSGGGRKPWKQKGTGRARQGSIRSPQWRHGGIVFGPLSHKKSIKVNKKVKQIALKSVLSFYQQKKRLKVVEKIILPQIKTSAFLEVLKNLNLSHKKVLFLDVNLENNLILSSRNINYIFLQEVSRTSVLQILKYQYLVLTQEAVKYYEELFNENK